MFVPACQLRTATSIACRVNGFLIAEVQHLAEPESSIWWKHDMIFLRLLIALAFLAALPLSIAAAGSEGGTSKGSHAPRLSGSGVCMGFGPQAPRDITKKSGINRRLFTPAPPYEQMNLCNIHTHTNAEHKGPGFSIYAGQGEHGGFKCNASKGLTQRQLSMPKDKIFYGNVKPGDSIEVHWVFTTCDVAPGPGLGSCSSNACANPQLRVESQVFLLVNDRRALDFGDFDHATHRRTAFHQPHRIPARTGTPIEFAGSTTGTGYDHAHCSPMQVTWSVRPRCAMLDINSLSEWGSDNVFEEDHSHGVRPLVTALELLAPIE